MVITQKSQVPKTQRSRQKCAKTEREYDVLDELVLNQEDRCGHKRIVECAILTQRLELSWSELF